VGKYTSNGLSIGWDAWLRENRNDPQKWEELLDMELEACAEESSLNMGTNIMAVVPKDLDTNTHHHWAE
jgi:hypothetical protein